MTGLAFSVRAVQRRYMAHARPITEECRDETAFPAGQARDKPVTGEAFLLALLVREQVDRLLECCRLSRVGVRIAAIA